MSSIVKKKKSEKPSDFPCPFCYAQEQGFGVSRPSIRAEARAHDPVCIFREIVQYPGDVGSFDWQDYLVDVVREILEVSRSPTERAKALIDAAAQARDVLNRFLRLER